MTNELRAKIIGSKLSAETVSTVSPLLYVKQVINSIFIQEVTVSEVITTILSLNTVGRVGMNFQHLLRKEVLITISYL